MNLEITSFVDAGNLSKERIVLNALTDLDVGQYALLRSGLSSDGKEPTSGRKIGYWFPDKAVKANDLVVLYTKKGTQSTKQTNEGRTVYFFYWGRDESLWGDKQHGAALLEVADWKFSIPS